MKVLLIIIFVQAGLSFFSNLYETTKGTYSKQMKPSTAAISVILNAILAAWILYAIYRW